MENYLEVSHQIMHLLLQFANGAVHTVEFWLVPAFNHAINFRIPFLHELYPTIDWNNYTIIWYHPQYNSVSPPIVLLPVEPHD